jgi:PAS domain S-box-containing protein
MQETKELREMNEILRESEARLAVTLDSIGDAVIVTDAAAIVTRLNPVAEQLTGWVSADAVGRPVQDIFDILNQETRIKTKIPVIDTLAHGIIQGLANHTVLISRDGKERSISDSCAPIRNREGTVIGSILVFRDVTKAYEIEQALHDSSTQIRTILDTVVDGIITFRAEDGIIANCNPAVEHMFACKSDDLIGSDLTALIPELYSDQADKSLEYFRASVENRSNGIVREVMGHGKTGRIFPLEISVGEMTLGNRRYFSAILRDISVRKRAEEEAIRANALQNAIFQSANFSSIATDSKGVIQIFNVGAETMLGYGASEVVNKITPADISDPQEVIERALSLSEELKTPISPGFEALVFKASRGIEDIYELTYIRKDGSRFPAVVSVTALKDTSGVIIGYLLIGTDNTARKIVEMERANLNQALQERNDELQIARIVADRANHAKSDFLSNMSHELRTPLSAILGFAQLMESGTPSPTVSQKKSIDQILKAGWYLLELINEILDLALIESGKLSMSMEPVSVSEILGECQIMIVPQAAKRDIAISFSDFDARYMVRADRTRLKQVFINLLSNAIKYNKDKGTITVDFILRPPDVVRINVRDTGIGLSPEKISQLFEPFNRLGQESIVEEGTGIGLVVSKRLIELMGGVIGVESTVGEGSTFWIEMSIIEENAYINAQEQSDEVAHKYATDEKTRTLLYIEDNPANMMLVEDIIARRSDLRMLSATNGIRGIETAIARLPDVILMDINLPGMSGIDALKVLQKNPVTAHIPIIALSANAIPRDIERGLEAGFFRYLTKPIRINVFLDTLDLALNGPEAKK